MLVERSKLTVARSRPGLLADAQLFASHGKFSASRKVEKFQNVSAQLKEVGAAAIARAFKRDGHGLLDSTWPLAHDYDSVAHVNCFIDIVGNEKHRRATGLPDAQHFVLHSHASERVERAERFIEKKNFWMINKRSRQSNALSHPAGKMMRVGVGKCFQAHEAHELFHFVTFLAQDATGDETHLNVAANR
jgi:hypothetical protein